ncbi:hypothetical protein CRG98_006027 [Punica granatum]|uniref:Uncharacterized protein n=1 Tax=Punica granatum TaxID=22663 RepID=A0A2I0KYN4_PUNGR|nr:hypothetical protein CRG98_006027 [Punica granatum]
MSSRRGPHTRFWIARLRSVRLPRGRVTDKHEKESPLTTLRPESRGSISYPGLGVMVHLVLLGHWALDSKHNASYGLGSTRKDKHEPKTVRTRISSRQSTHARAYETRLGSVHLPGDERRKHVRRSRHLPFYDPKVEGRQVTQVLGYGVHLKC